MQQKRVIRQFPRAVSNPEGYSFFRIPTCFWQRAATDSGETVQRSGTQRDPTGLVVQWTFAAALAEWRGLSVAELAKSSDFLGKSPEVYATSATNFP